MNVVLVTGSAGLIGGETAEYFSPLFDAIVGLDNNMRQTFFGEEASTDWNRARLEESCPNYRHVPLDIRDAAALDRCFAEYGKDIRLVVHAAAQPSHDWAARDPQTDFTVNANGTLNMLEATRKHCPDAVFIFTSTNKVYGDRPNDLPLIEQETRWELDPSHPFARDGIDENMSLDQCKHSLFGASKAAADLLVQEYGRYFGMKTGVFRGGCLTGPCHSGTQLHGFLSYLAKCAVEDTPYTIFGYKGKQVRDNIHARDLIRMFHEFYQAPRPGEVYNVGGSRHSHCSVLEAVSKIGVLVGKPMRISISETARIGDHIWYVSDIGKFRRHYPNWAYEFDLDAILRQICEAQQRRSQADRDRPGRKAVGRLGQSGR